MDSTRFLSDESYKIASLQSINELIAENAKSNPYLSPFLDVFYHLIQAKVDAPLEIIWCYSFIKFRCSHFVEDNILDRISAANNLFLLVSRCSASCKSSKSVALLAPVVFQLYKLVEDLFADKDRGSKVWKKASHRVKALTSELISYASLCSFNNIGECVSDSKPSVLQADLISLWGYDQRTMLNSFFPLASSKKNTDNDIKKVLDVDNLSGIVIAELFLLKLCFDLRLEKRGPHLEKELRSWAVASINAFQNLYFFDIILKILLEPSLCISSLLSAEDELLLKSVLYDVTMLVDYNFLSHENVLQLPICQARNLFLRRLLVTSEAMEFFRNRGAHNKGYCDTVSFSNSKFYLPMAKQILREVAVEYEVNKLKEMSPGTLLKWLVELECQGIKLFHDTDLLNRAKLAVKYVKSECEAMSFRDSSSAPDSDLLVYIDTKGDVEKVGKDEKETSDFMSAALVCAARSMQHGKISEKRRGLENKGSGKRSKLDHSEDADSEEILENSSSGSGDETGSLTSDDDCN